MLSIKYVSIHVDIYLFLKYSRVQAMPFLLNYKPPQPANKSMNINATSKGHILQSL